MKKLIVANLKMNPQTFTEADRLARAASSAARKVKNVEVVFCPPFVWLECLAAEYGKKAIFGGQDAFWEERGAYTGEISPVMLKNIGARYVIIGHSERRIHLGETDEMINKKIKAALGAGLKVILCVGETLKEHRAGRTKFVLARQLRKDLKSVSKLNIYNSKLVIAYEPIWAIGTGLAETPMSAGYMADFIRRVSGARRVIYGGSVSAKNIKGFLSRREIDGALVGGASLDAGEFSKIIKIAAYV